MTIRQRCLARPPLSPPVERRVDPLYRLLDLAHVTCAPGALQYLPHVAQGLHKRGERAGAASRSWCEAMSGLRRMTDTAKGGREGREMTDSVEKL